MSRIAPSLFAILTAGVVLSPYAHTAQAQETYGPVLTEDNEDALPEARQQADPCETQPQDDDVILVCRTLEDDEAYRSPLPAPTASDRPIIPGLNDPPCWVTDPGAVGTTGCIRFGSAPPAAVIIDLTQFPEPLDAEHAAAVLRVEPRDKDDKVPPRPTGERVPIDLTDVREPQL